MSSPPLYSPRDYQEEYFGCSSSKATLDELSNTFYTGFDNLIFAILILMVTHHFSLKLWLKYSLIILLWNDKDNYEWYYRGYTMVNCVWRFNIWFFFSFCVRSPSGINERKGRGREGGDKHHHPRIYWACPLHQPYWSI